MPNKPLSASQIQLLRELADGRTNSGLHGTTLIDFAKLLQLRYVKLRGDHFEVTDAGQTRLNDGDMPAA